MLFSNTRKSRNRKYDKNAIQTCEKIYTFLHSYLLGSTKRLRKCDAGATRQTAVKGRSAATVTVPLLKCLRNVKLTSLKRSSFKHKGNSVIYDGVFLLWSIYSLKSEMNGTLGHCLGFLGNRSKTRNKREKKKIPDRVHFYLVWYGLSVGEGKWKSVPDLISKENKRP